MANQPTQGEPPANIPQRKRGGNAFPEEASEKISQFPKMNRFGEPEDIIPKGASEGVEDFKKEQEEKKQEPEKKPDPTQDLQSQPGDQYEGPSIQDLERRSLIKNIIIGAVIVIVLIVIGIFVYSQWFSKPAEVEVTEEPVEEEETIEGDKDNDNLPDEWEEQNGLNFNDQRDATLDPDFDRLTNLEEYEYGTDPNNSDTDNDGYKDGDEVRGGFNPNGTGRLNSNINGDESYYPTLKGVWEGTISGNLYNSSLFNLTMQSNGSSSGKLNMTLSSLQEGDIQSDLSGTFTYSQESSLFKSSLIANSAYMKGKNILSKGEFTLNLDGRASNDNNISGTWTLIPEVEQFWLKQDRGNFSLNKMSIF